ncbi:MAG TPA: alpha/beta fold hydrolase [Gammaproteobacteria bacterium]|nr:alpha/beta fold hydrolase [Gammaproteobacteria bacterium]
MTEAPSTLGVGFIPPRLLRHAHLQSILASVGLRDRALRRAAAAMLGAARNVLLEVDGVRLLGRYSAQPFAGGGDRTAAKLLVVLHGWEGSSESPYVVALCGRAYRSGFDVFRLNFRDHGGTAALNEGLFHSCRLDEVVAAVAEIGRRYPSRKTFLVGFSLGGNFALRVAASGRVDNLITKVVAVCPVLRPASTMRALEDGLWLYRDHFLRRWRRSLAAKAAAFPHLYDFGDLRRFRTLTETTAFFVSRYTSFEDLDAYLNGYTLTGDVLARLSIPAWLLAARDDPVIPSDDLTAVARPDALEVTLAPWGGHCGFVENFKLESWLDRRVLAALG